MPRPFFLPIYCFCIILYHFVLRFCLGINPLAWLIWTVVFSFVLAVRNNMYVTPHMCVTPQCMNNGGHCEAGLFVRAWSMGMGSERVEG